MLGHLRNEKSMFLKLLRQRQFRVPRPRNLCHRCPRMVHLVYALRILGMLWMMITSIMCRHGKAWEKATTDTYRLSGRFRYASKFNPPAMITRHLGNNSAQSPSRTEVPKQAPADFLIPRMWCQTQTTSRNASFSFSSRTTGRCSSQWLSSRFRWFGLRT